MQKSLSQNLLFTLLTFSSLSRQNKWSSFHTKAHFLRQLQECKHFISLASVHSEILKSGFLSNTITLNRLINCYVRINEIQVARQLFDEMLEPNVVSYTSLMAGYINMDQPQVALLLLRKMLGNLVWPNEFTFATVIKACSMLADLLTGKQIHTHIETFGFQNNLVVCSSLVDMYGKCNDVDGARRVFDLMGCRNVVSWTSMIVAYAQNAQGHEGLEMFREFNYQSRDRPSQHMLSSGINACASLGRLVSGKVAHGVVIRSGYESNDVVASALVDMYAKCGCVSYSEKVFKRISNPSVVPYTSMIVGAAKYGLGRFSLDLFNEMIARGIKPNDVTFIGVLHACSHSGLVDEGIQHLDSMYWKYGVIPDAKHYTCVVDMLGRTGRLDEAYKLAKSIQVDPDTHSILWSTLLLASRLHGRVDIAVEASNQLIESNQQVAHAYVTLSNTYALAGEWENVHTLRSEMKRAGVYKEPGCSWVQIRDQTYAFYAGNASFERGREVLSLLRELKQKMKERGYVGGKTGLVFVDVEDEAREEIVGLHSERLALAFGLISIPKGITIRIMKNLRMCRDCHDVFKLISDIVERDFVVRDVNRFHHFKNGSCSCADFW